MKRISIVAAVLVLVMNISPLLRAADDADAVQAGTLWTGTLSGDERKAGPQSRERGAQLRILVRDGKRFTARFIVRGNATFVLLLEGEIRGKQLAAKATKVVKGAWPDGTLEDLWTGIVDGEKMVLKHTSSKNLVSTAELKLERGASSPDDSEKD